MTNERDMPYGSDCPYLAILSSSSPLADARLAANIEKELERKLVTFILESLK